MISARLIKAIENKGFFLEFPNYDSSEDIIIEILREDNYRLNLAIPFFLMDKIDYNRIILKLGANQKREFEKIILISDKIYRKEGVSNNIKDLIKENRITRKFSSNEFEDCYGAFKESLVRAGEKTQEIIKKQSKLRLNLDLNKSLAVLFSPAKIKIMSKIFNHEKLSNTELKYYYRSISNINKAVLNQSVQDYLRNIEISKKFY
ncbi:MAG: hypothetical protein AABX96_04570 [Nanoarchaeota archaeon]|mgnify:CR=1 FL=1